MSKYRTQCGPNAVDEYDGYTTSQENSSNNRKWYLKERSHYVTGSGIVTSCNACSYTSQYKNVIKDYYILNDGITELGDECLSKESIRTITLPKSLKVIGNKCFTKSSIKEIELPDELEEIGENNFPETLESLTLPPLINQFAVNNVALCNKLTSIEVEKGNKSYCSKNGILYNYDMTTIIRCPKGKRGSVIIPTSVKTIGEHCFDGCTKISRISIPHSVKKIGDYAFSGITVDKLSIPNSVENIGIGCLSNSKVSESLKLPALIKEIPDYFLNGSAFQLTDFFKNVEKIGRNSFDEADSDSLPDIIKLPKIRIIGSHAFCNVSKEYWVSSNLEDIRDGAFSDTDDNFKLRIFSLAPIKVSENAFEGISEDATLIIPKHTKIIFENAIPWNQFENIEEIDVSEDDSDNISEEEWANRLRDILFSINHVNRDYVKDIIDSIKENFYYVEDDDSYAEAKELIRYNYLFRPAIEPGLEVEICKAWPNKYKIKIFNYAILNNHNLSFGKTTDIGVNLDKKLEVIDEPHLIELPETDGSISNVYFNGIFSILKEELSKVQTSLKVAVSWFTNYTLFKVLKNLSDEGVAVSLIINNDLINNGGYCLDFNELIDAGVEMHLVEYPELLHHKFCIIDDNEVITGSYNWTRFSEHNYENIMVVKEHNIVEQFCDEFNMLVNTHPEIDKMPEKVPDRPQYDRSAFRQYITEELDLEARSTNDDRDKITALNKAKTLNKEYLALLQKNENNNSKSEGVISNEGISTEQLERQASSNAVQDNLREISALEKRKKELSERRNGNNDFSNNVDSQNEIQQIDSQIEANKQAIETIKKSAEIQTEGGRGSLKINLKWSTKDDLDLHVIDPDKQEIWYSDKKKTCQGSLGQLDVDTNAGSPYKTNPQENIYWDSKAPLGVYEVKVVYYAQHDNKDNINFTVTVYPEKGEVKTFTGVMRTVNEVKNVTRFKITEKGIEYL